MEGIRSARLRPPGVISSGAKYATGNHRAQTILYAIEVVSATGILLWTFRAAGFEGVGWAIITAILILQPGMDQSIKASKVRILATLIGASIGALAGLLLGGNVPALLAGVIAAIAFCHAFGLDHHLRQACLTVPIIQMSQEGAIVHVTFERVVAVLAGCVVPLFVQYAGHLLLRRSRHHPFS